MNIFNDMEELFECSAKNKTILSLYLSYIYLHVDSSVVAEKFENIDIEGNFLEARNIIFKELIDNYSYNYTASIIINRKDCTLTDIEKFNLDNIKVFYENIKLISSASYKKMNQICRKIRENIFCFESVFLSEIISQPYDIKKGNLFKLIVLEYVIQSVYLCDYLFIQKKYYEIQVLSEISINFLKEVKDFIINFDYKVNVICSYYSHITEKCINQRKKLTIDERKVKSLNIIKGDKRNFNESNLDLVSNKINVMYKENKKYPEVVELFKSNLSDRKIIESKEYLDEIIIKTIDQTKNIYWRNHRDNISPSELRVVLEHWIATEFKVFCERKGIKFHNMILVFIMQCNSKI